MPTPKKLTLKKETIAHLTSDELIAAQGGTSSPVITVTEYTPQTQKLISLVCSDPCGKLQAGINWWQNTGGKQVVSRALCTGHCPLSGGTLTGRC